MKFLVSIAVFSVIITCSPSKLTGYRQPNRSNSGSSSSPQIGDSHQGSTAPSIPDAGSASGTGLPVSDDLTPNLRQLDQAMAPVLAAYAQDLTAVAVATQAPSGPFGVKHLTIDETASSGRALRLTIGQAGQIISLEDGASGGVGEILAPYPFVNVGGDFVDWVIQNIIVYTKTLFVDPVSGTQKPAILQQAGSVYTKTPAYNYGTMTQPTFSPRLWEMVDSPKGTYAGLFYPLIDQPNAVTSDLVSKPAETLVFQQIKALGAQVIQVTGALYNIGSRPVDRLSQPWGVYNRGLLPLAVHGNPAGAYVNDSPIFASGAGSGEFTTDTTSWIAFINKDGFPNGRGLAVIGGLDNKTAYFADNSPLIAGLGVFSTNGAGGSLSPAYATEVVRNIGVAAGQAMYFRYFLVLDYASNLQARAVELSPFATQGPLATEDPPTLKGVCLTGADFHSCQSGETPRLFTFSSFVDGARPLFKISRQPSKDPVITDDPYIISAHAPYDGSTAYVEFLGWVTATNPNQQGLFKNTCLVGLTLLRDLFPDKTHFPPDDGASEKLWVMTSSQSTNRPCAN